MTQRPPGRHVWDTALDPQGVPLFLALQWAQRRSLAPMRPLLAEHSLSIAGFDVLATLRNAPPPHALTPSQVQAEAVISSGGLTKVMLQLEQRGLVVRPLQGDDRRVKPVQLTAPGCALVEQLMQQLVADTGQWLRSALSDEDIARLTALLNRLAAAPQ